MSPVPLFSVCFWPCAVCGQVLPYKDRGMEGQGLPLAPNIREAARLLKKYKRMGQSCLFYGRNLAWSFSIPPSSNMIQGCPSHVGEGLIKLLRTNLGRWPLGLNVMSECTSVFVYVWEKGVRKELKYRWIKEAFLKTVPFFPTLFLWESLSFRIKHFWTFQILLV